ncbi:MAG: hypothetical protein RLZZ450_4752 [Pseudomonadota bacterium]
MRPDARAFSSTFVGARARFREAASSAGFELSCHRIGQLGPDGTELTIDVAVRGSHQARRALVMSSGLHGVEGYFGSAVQHSWLTGAGSVPSAERREVLIHALNPFGFAWRRRVNENNVDLNRNFMLRGAPNQGAPQGYRDLDTLLNPPSAPRRLEPPFVLQALPPLVRHGFRSLKNAVAQGQYEFPRGVFYGGDKPALTQQILAQHLRSWVGEPEHVLHLDWHTGRGASGSYALCVDLPMESPRVARLRNTFGDECVESFDPNGVLYEIKGALGPWLEQQLPGVQYDCLLAEFGTYNAIKVLEAMRFENRAHLYGQHDPALLEQGRHRMFEAFCPASPAWRERVLASALHVAEQAAAAVGA